MFWQKCTKFLITVHIDQKDCQLLGFLKILAILIDMQLYNIVRLMCILLKIKWNKFSYLLATYFVTLQKVSLYIVYELFDTYWKYLLFLCIVLLLSNGPCDKYK